MDLDSKFDFNRFISKIGQFPLLIDFYDLLIDFFCLLIDLFYLFIDLLIEMDRFYSKIAIFDLILLLDFESDQNRRSNSDTDFDSTTTIRFATPNRISLENSQKLWPKKMRICI